MAICYKASKRGDDQKNSKKDRKSLEASHKLLHLMPTLLGGCVWLVGSLVLFPPWSKMVLDPVLGDGDQEKGWERGRKHSTNVEDYLF